MLDRRARAILERDRAAFMATLATDSRLFVERQERLFRWLGDVPLESYELTVAWDRFGDLTRPKDLDRYPTSDAVMIPVTEERYQIRGFDPKPAAEDLFYTFVRQDGEWLIAEDDDVSDLALYSARHLWDFGPIEQHESEHFLLLAHPCKRDGGCLQDGPFLELAEEGMRTIERYWPVRWHRRTVVLVPKSGAELQRMIQSTFDLNNFVAFAYSTVDLADGLDYTGHRIIPNPKALEGRSNESVGQILAHEMLHIATRDHAGPFVPIFVDEGFADYAGNDADPGALAFFNSEVAAGLFSGAIPEDFEFTIGDGTDIYRSYQEAQSAVRFFVDRWGLDAFVRFYRKLGRLEIVTGTTRYHVDRALKQTAGVDYETFQRMWADSIT